MSAVHFVQIQTVPDIPAIRRVYGLPQTLDAEECLAYALQRLRALHGGQPPLPDFLTVIHAIGVLSWKSGAEGFSPFQVWHLLSGTEGAEPALIGKLSSYLNQPPGGEACALMVSQQVLWARCLYYALPFAALERPWLIPDAEMVFGNTTSGKGALTLGELQDGAAACDLFFPAVKVSNMETQLYTLAGFYLKGLRVQARLSQTHFDAAMQDLGRRIEEAKLKSPAADPF